MKKLLLKLGLIPIIILTVGLLGALPVMAEDGPGPLEEASVEVTVDPGLPDYVLNDGSGVVDINLTIVFESTPQYYILFVEDPSGAERFNSGQINISGQPSPYTDNTTWSYTVADGDLVGNWSVTVEYYSGDSPPYDREGFSGNTFKVGQTVQVLKFNDENGNSIWDGGEPEITGVWTANIAGNTANTTGYNYSALMPIEVDLFINGGYSVTENPMPDWVQTTASPQQFTIPTTDDVIIYIGNQEEPQLGELLIHKYLDLNGNGVDDDGVDGVGWTFDIYGPDNPALPYALDQDTDANGDILLTDVPAGQYRVVEDEDLTAFDPIYRCTDPGPSMYVNVTVLDEQQAYVDFGNQQLGDLIIFKYIDANGNGIPDDAADAAQENWGFQVSGSTYYTDSSGYIVVENLIPGTYSVTEVSGPSAPPGFAWVCTDPGPGKTKSGISVPTGGSSAEVQFGNQLIEHEVPTLSQWGIIAMSAAFVALIGLVLIRRRPVTQAK